MSDEFFEPDEPVEDVVRAFDAGYKFVTGEPLPSTEAVGEVRREVHESCAAIVVADLEASGWVGPKAIEVLFEQRDTAIAERDQLRQHILDIDAHATPYGDIPDEPGWIGTYLLTAGALHRALGKIGHSAPNCTAEAQRDTAIRERDEARNLYAETCDVADSYLTQLHAVRAELETARTEAARDHNSVNAFRFERDQAIADLKAFGGEVERLYEVEREAERMRKVVEAAQAWRRIEQAADALEQYEAGADALDSIAAAVDVYTKEASDG